MAKPSTIETLPADILSGLQELLRDPRVSQMEATGRINAILGEQGLEPVSKSAVNRYAMRMEKVGSELRQSREMAEMWIAKLGPQATQGQVGNLVNEILRTLTFKLSMKLHEGDISDESLPEVITMLRGLSLSVMRLEKASSENLKREEEIRRQERERLLKTVDEAASSEPGKAMTAERLKEMIRESYGV